MKTTENTIPLLATHPGKVLLDEIKANDFTQSDFAKKIGLKKSQLNEIIKRKRNINAELAILLEKTLNIDAEYWLEIQKNYDLDKARINIKNQQRLEAIEQWKFIENKIATSFLKKEKVLSGDPIEDIIAVKKIYNVQNFEELAKLNAKPAYARFRKSTKLEIDPINIIGWVKLLHFNASRIFVEKFDYDKKNELITKLKQILRINKNTLVTVQLTLADFGIKLIYQRKGDKTPVDGISFWSNGSPAIGMSLRHSRLDNFAFTLFHELGHIFEHLPNNNKAEFVDLIASKEQKDYKKSKEEKEADLFAQKNMIESKNWKVFFLNQRFDDRSIIEFAKENEIHPCIVRGRICFTTGFYKAKTSIDYSIY
ncbi:MAG: HigA family addiction module antidote protein [Bacteroidales bacterium]|nr:HigA family addiction module antidote protein [Bacteroidales bacterium]